MCGISGYISETNQEQQLVQSMEAMRYRGPDSSGYILQEINNLNYGVGHVRLKVIDLDERSSQPFYASSGKSLVVFNGEIYNFKELRNLLPHQEWKTTSDTEVITELLDQLGVDIVRHFNGIFAISFLCLKSGKMSLIRDPLGVKPLYYYKKDQALYFASEIKALSSFSVDLEFANEDILEAMSFGYVHEPNTGFKYIKKIAPGEIVTFDNRLFHSDTFVYEQSSGAFSNETVSSAIERQCVADVPLGTFFSGGLDSTVIAAEVNTDLLYIDGHMDEGISEEEQVVRKLATTLERKLDVAKLPRTSKFEDIIAVVDQVIDGIEEPVTDLTYLVSYDLAKIAKNKGFTVMLSGMGADELFGGYLRYYITKFSWIFNPALAVYSTMASLFKFGSKHKLDRIKYYLKERNFLGRYTRLVGYFSSEELKSLFGSEQHKQLESQMHNRIDALIPNPAKKNPFLCMRYLEMRGFLAHNLLVADKSSMRASIEMRVPFLDLEVTNKWFDESMASAGWWSLGKKPLLQLLQKKINYKWSPFTKTGFNPSIPAFFEGLEATDIERLMINSKVTAILKEDGLSLVLKSCFEGGAINYHKVWQMIFITRWVEYWQKKQEEKQV